MARCWPPARCRSLGNEWRNQQTPGIGEGRPDSKNSAGNTDNFGSAPDLNVSSTITVQSSLIGEYNGTSLVAAATPDASGNIIGTHAAPIDPKLGPLANNGGSTQTHALLAGSPALNRGNNSLAIDPFSQLPLTTDQRGLDRTAGIVDMGAFEKQHVWHNTVHAFDVVGSGSTVDNVVSPGDALAIINYINA